MTTPPVATSGFRSGSPRPQAATRLPIVWTPALYTLAIALLALIFLLRPVNLQAAQTAPNKGEPVRVVYGFDREFPPFTYDEPGGQPAGFGI